MTAAVRALLHRLTHPGHQLQVHGAQSSITCSCWQVWRAGDRRRLVERREGWLYRRAYARRGRWVVTERRYDTRNGPRGGPWTTTTTRAGAELQRRRILAGRYRGSQAWDWRRHGWYTVPIAEDLTVVRAGGRRG